MVKIRTLIQLKFQNVHTVQFYTVFNFIRHFEASIYYITHLITGTTFVDIEFTWHHVSFQYSHHPHHSPHSSDHWAGDVPHFLLVVKYLDKNKTCHVVIGKHTIRNTLVMFSGFLLFYIKKCTIYKSLEILLAAVLGFLAFCCPDLDATFSKIF